MQSLSNLYQDMILDHYRHPRNSGVIARPHAHAEARNPLCGDRVQLTLTFDSSGRVNEARFTGEGCSIAKASASMLTVAIHGRTREEMRAMHEQVMTLLAGEGGEGGGDAGDGGGDSDGSDGSDGSAPANGDEANDVNDELQLGDLRALAGVARFPARVKCARMAWDALMQAV